jgi:NADPH2:quinone reductase
MRAVVVEKLGGPEVLRFTEFPDPQPRAGQVIVQVAAAGVNYMDIYQREGVGGYKPAQFPVVPGGEGAGTVTAVAGDVTGLSVGDRVAWAGVPGSYAEQAA